MKLYEKEFFRTKVELKSLYDLGMRLVDSINDLNIEKWMEFFNQIKEPKFNAETWEQVSDLLASDLAKRYFHIFIFHIING